MHYATAFRWRHRFLDELRFRERRLLRRTAEAAVRQDLAYNRRVRSWLRRFRRISRRYEPNYLVWFAFVDEAFPRRSRSGSSPQVWIFDPGWLGRLWPDRLRPPIRTRAAKAARELFVRLSYLPRLSRPTPPAGHGPPPAPPVRPGPAGRPLGFTMSCEKGLSLVSVSL